MSVEKPLVGASKPSVMPVSPLREPGQGGGLRFVAAFGIILPSVVSGLSTRKPTEYNVLRNF